jgi:proton glutamate symport protein
MQPRSSSRGLALHWKILIGLILGIIVGIAIDQFWTAGTWAAMGVNEPSAFMASRPGEPFRTGVPHPANEDAGIVAHTVRAVVNATIFLGQFFFRALRFIAVPIILFSLIVGVASLGNLRRLGRIGAKTVLIFLGTTAVSIVIGLSLANAIKPGSFIPEESRATMQAAYERRVQASVEGTAQVPTLWKQGLDFVPSNPFEALATAMMPPGSLPGQGTLLQVIATALIVGIGLTMIAREKAAVVIDFCDAMTDVIVKLVQLVMLIAPYAVFALIVPAIVMMGLHVLKGVGVYAATLLSGLLIVLVLVYPTLLWGVARMGPGRFFSGMAPAMLTAFSSSSSSATLPITMQCTRERLGVSERITSFVAPLGATINMAGTAMYQGIAALFIAQMYNIELTLAQQLTIVLTATLAAIGTPGIPGAGVVMLVIVLEAVHIPPAGIAVILGVDRLLDMARTVVNVSGDATAAVIVAKTEGELGPARPESA